MNDSITIRVAAHREDHPALPYVYYDNQNNPDASGWVLRCQHWAGQVHDEILYADNPDDPDEAVAEAATTIAHNYLA